MSPGDLLNDVDGNWSLDKGEVNRRLIFGKFKYSGNEEAIE